MASPAAFNCFETATSARDGSTFPDGWLWATKTLRALHSRANRNTSRGLATDASTVPMWQTWQPMTREAVESADGEEHLAVVALEHLAANAGGVGRRADLVGDVGPLADEPDGEDGDPESGRGGSVVDRSVCGQLRRGRACAFGRSWR